MQIVPMQSQHAAPIPLIETPRLLASLSRQSSRAADIGEDGKNALRQVRETLGKSLDTIDRCACDDVLISRLVHPIGTI
jgi:hypothetical protein